MTQKAGPDLGVNPFTGGQEPGHLVHAFTESSSVFPKNGGIRVQGSCWENEVRHSVRSFGKDEHETVLSHF